MPLSESRRFAPAEGWSLEAGGSKGREGNIFLTVNRRANESEDTLFFDVQDRWHKICIFGIC